MSFIAVWNDETQRYDEIHEDHPDYERAAKACTVETTADTRDPAVVALLESGVRWEYKEAFGDSEDYPGKFYVGYFDKHHNHVIVASEFLNEQEARIAACAPEALRLLQSLEWREDVNGVEYCAICAGDAPNHQTPCELDALLRKAGAR